MAYPGTRDPQSLTAYAPVVDTNVGVAPITSSHVEVFNAAIEVDDRLLAPLVPPALHLTLPPMASFLIWQFHDSDLGPFTLAQTRVTTRLLARSRGFLLGSYFEGSPAAAEQLRSHWGFECRPGTIRVRSFHDEVLATVDADGRNVLRIVGRSPHALVPDDIRDMAGCNPVRQRTPQGEQLRLLQVDTEFRVQHASRSIDLRLEEFVGGAWDATDLRQEYGVRALHYRCEMRIPPPRYMIDPALPSDQTSEQIHHEAPVG